MDNIVNIATVSDYNAHWGIADRHPLVNVLEGSQVTEPIPNCLKNFGVYVVFLKDVICADNYESNNDRRCRIPGLSHTEYFGKDQ